MMTNEQAPEIFYSWTILNNMVALKKVDKSAFIHHGTGIPQELKKHFQIVQTDVFYEKKVKLCHNQIEYNAYFQMSEDYRFRLFWHTDFIKLMKAKMPESFRILVNDIEHGDDEIGFIRFETVDDTRYIVNFINPDVINHDVQNESSLDDEAQAKNEGKASYTFSVKYERNAKNREAAIAYHGCKCAVCGFDFEVIYGDRGNGFIEVHHIKPLYYSQTEIQVNPKTDLIPVCSNCHRMIHRDKENVLSIEQIRELCQYKL